MAEEYFKKEGYDVEVKELPVGDYVIGDEVVFEYKGGDDFLSSLVDGRLWNESINQKLGYSYHFVVVGASVSVIYQRACRQGFSTGRFISLKQIYGAVARLNTYTTVLMCPEGFKEGLYLMNLQALKCLEHPGYLPRKVRYKDENPCYNYLAYCVPNIGDKKANLIIDELQIKDLKGLLKISKDDLLNIDGVGNKTADMILSKIKGGI